MRRPVFLSTLLMFVLALAACGGGDARESAAAPAAQASGAATLNEDYDNALPVASQLILGSLRLEDGDQTINAEEAGKLLPLWQAYQSLSNSDTAAQAELDALVRQITGAMRAEQVAAIAAMQLTGDDIGQALQDLGSGAGARGGFPAAEPGGGGGFAPPDGGFLGPGGGAGGPGGFGQANPEERATAIAERMAQNGGQAASFMTRGLVNQLITTLQLKTGELTEADLQAQQAQRAVFRWLPLVAETTGISIDVLREAVDGGKTVAEAVQANGGDMAAVEAALREALQANPDLDEQAIAEQIAAVLNGKAAPGE